MISPFHNPNKLASTLFKIIAISLGSLPMLAQPESTPTPGFRIAISSNFDQMMQQAPILDPEHPRFHEGNALFWRDQVIKAFFYNALLAPSDSLKSNLSGTDFFIDLTSSLEEQVRSMKEVIEKIEAIKPETQQEEYGLRFMSMWFTDTIELANTINEVNRLYAALEADYVPVNIEKVIEILNDREERVKMLIYRPSPNRTDFQTRQTIWLQINKFNQEIKTSGKSKIDILYLIVPGDTLNEIAQTNGVQLKDLVDINRITDANLIEVGQLIQLR